jgi:hypothetical protein
MASYSEHDCEGRLHDDPSGHRTLAGSCQSISSRLRPTPTASRRTHQRGSLHSARSRPFLIQPRLCSFSASRLGPNVLISTDLLSRTYATALVATSSSIHVDSYEVSSSDMNQLKLTLIQHAIDQDLKITQIFQRIVPPAPGSSYHAGRQRRVYLYHRRDHP